MIVKTGPDSIAFYDGAPTRLAIAEALLARAMHALGGCITAPPCGACAYCAGRAYFDEEAADRRRAMPSDPDAIRAASEGKRHG